MTRFMKFAILGAALAVPATSAFATPITPGTTVTGTVVETSFPTGASPTLSGMLSTSTYTGSYREYVYKDSQNTLCSTVGSCLTFAFQVGNASTSNDGIEHVTVGPELTTGYLYNVGYAASPSGTDNPGSVDFSLYGGTLSFNFAGLNAIAPGTASSWLIIQTSATNYGFGNFSTIDNTTFTTTGLVTASATPEPSSLMLLGTGLLSAAGVAIRKRAIV